MNNEQKSEIQHVAPRMNCGDIQGVLFDYMTHELGEGRSALVREHLRKCRACSREAAEIQETLDLLRDDSRIHSERPQRLSDERRERLARAYLHPLLDWIYMHHILVSVLLAVMVLLITAGVLLHLKIRRDRPVEVGPPVLINGGPGGDGCAP